MTITLTPEQEQAVREEAERRRETPEQTAQDALRDALRRWRKPESPADITPLRPLPAGKTRKEVFDAIEPWPGDETDAELLAALKRLDAE